MYDVIIIGSGPVGLSCAIEAKKLNLSSIVVDKGYFLNSIYHFPQNMTFFSTPELLEIGDIPFIISGEKPKRADAMKYYWRVAQYYKLDIKLFRKVNNIIKKEKGFTLQTDKEEFLTRNVILATGYYDNPNLLGVLGENLPHVSHYYTDPHKYIHQKVIIVGANNSAVEAALELYRYDVSITMVHRDSELSKGVKYWVLPDIKNRIENKEIPSYFESKVEEIKPQSVIIRHKDKRIELPADSVLSLTGYHPDFVFMNKIGINIDRETSIPIFNPDTGETNMAGIYIAGSLQAGKNANKIFIENGRLHGKVIAIAIKHKE
ncbi:MAG TPA: YpdA family putative bacillithiol disulfide reductase [Candidatus Eremiobacteraeota bacterium]|nr:MAG: putative oxidoreductase CzcO [bacterium ADurb.Bin363]HPZ10472.1 YpdA family putative bacillithiol disulfide reductase [Candidatus Eremiobacteraeota bacterium]